MRIKRDGMNPGTYRWKAIYNHGTPGERQALIARRSKRRAATEGDEAAFAALMERVSDAKTN